MIELHQNPIGNALWRAGAGAGKTYNLVERVLRIEEEWRKRPENRGHAPRVVVTTFTRMATQELRVRLMEAALRSPRQSELVPFVTSRSQLFVTTMHGVMDSFLRTFGTAIGLEPGFRVAGPDELDILIRRTGKRVFFPNSAQEISGAENVAVDQSVLDEVLAEYGFAQALIIVHRISKIRREFQYSDRPAKFAVSSDFTRLQRKLLAEQSKRMRELVSEIESNQTSEKWNPFLDWLNRGIELFSQLDDLQIAIESINTWQENEPKIRNAGSMKIEFRAGSNWKNPIKNIEKLALEIKADIAVASKFEALNKAIDSIESKFSSLLNEEKLRQGLIEIEDLEIFSSELIHRCPEAAKSFASSWDHWLIDEFQDTSPRQVELIRELTRGIPQFVVGDPQQSIYLFRGARPGVFHEREILARETQHELTELMGNRRSHPDVMSFVNKIVSGFRGEFHQMTSERSNQENLGRRKESIGSPFGAATFYVGEAASHSQDEQRRIEAHRIAAVVSQILKAGASPASIAVLARSNRELGYVAREFARSGLPFQLHTAGAYSDRLETADLCALLGFLSNPHDDDNLIHLARTAWFPIHESILSLGYRRLGSLWSKLDSLLIEKQISDADQIMVQSLKSALLCVKERGIVQAFREVLGSCEFFSWCGILDPSGRREANALKFLTKLVVAERQSGFLPRKFTDEILGGGERGGEGESTDRDAVAAVKPDRIHLMTIHVSKGLEFDHVILPFLAETSKKPIRLKEKFVFHETERLWSAAVSTDDEGSLSAGPLSRDWHSIFQDWSLEESRRLLYVALTRARESIFLSATLDSDSEPPEESFLSYLNLNRLGGEHGTYKTLAEEPQFNSEFLKLRHESSEMLKPFRRDLGDAKPTLVSQTSISVTALLEKHQFESDRGAPAPDKFIGQDNMKPLRMATSAARGTRLHRVFEMAKSASIDRQEKMASEIARWFRPDEQAAALAALQWVLAIKSPNLEAIIASGEVEWGFAYLAPQRQFIVEGQIDLWGRDTHGQLWIVDYKTGNTDYYEKAFEQLSYYSEALVAAGIAHLGEEVGLAAIFPYAQRIYEKSIIASFSNLPS